MSSPVHGTDAPGPQDGGAPAAGGARASAGAFDVRNVIAGLIGVYGLVLVLVGLFGDRAEEAARTGGVAANLWSGIGMLVVAAGFGLWTRLRPILVDAPPPDDDGPAGPPGH